MSPGKSERLLNLLIALLSTRRYLSREALRSMVEPYREARSDTAFERQFERDKEELRSIGIEIETGSNEVFFDEEEGYRISRASYELPEISFTPEELAALGLAGQVWQDTLAADHTLHAFEALRAGGADPDPTLLPAVQPHVDVHEAEFDVVYDAVVSRRQITFGYHGQQRRLEPWMLLQRRGRWYVLGRDVDKDDDRFFKLTRFTAPPVAQGKAGAFQIPDDVHERARRIEPSDGTRTLVAVRDDAARPLGAEPAEGAAAPAGYSPWWLSARTEDALVQEILSAGADLLVLEPLELRTRVIAALEEATA